MAMSATLRSGAAAEFLTGIKLRALIGIPYVSSQPCLKNKYEVTYIFLGKHVFTQYRQYPCSQQCIELLSSLRS